MAVLVEVEVFVVVVDAEDADCDGDDGRADAERTSAAAPRQGTDAIAIAPLIPARIPRLSLALDGRQPARVRLIYGKIGSTEDLVRQRWQKHGPRSLVGPTCWKTAALERPPRDEDGRPSLVTGTILGSSTRI